MPCNFSVGALAEIETAEGVMWSGMGSASHPTPPHKRSDGHYAYYNYNAVKLLTTPERFRIKMDAV